MRIDSPILDHGLTIRSIKIVVNRLNEAPTSDTICTLRTRVSSALLETD